MGAVADVLERRRHRLLPASIVALAGVSSMVSALTPRAADELLDLQTSGGLAPVLSGRTAAVELGVVLLMAARSLARGSRAAWVLATAVAAVTAAVSLVQLRPSTTGIVSLAALATLVATRSAFRLRWPPGVRTPLLLTAGLLGGLVLYGVVAYTEIDQLSPAGGSRRAGVVLRTMLFLPGGVDSDPALITAYAASLRIGLLGLLAAAAWAVWRSSVAARRPETPADVRRFVEEHGASSTAPLLALPDNALLPLCRGRALAGVGVRNGVAVCLGGPVAPVDVETEALAELIVHCERAGWTPALLAVDDRQRALAAAAGFSALQVGVEAVLDVSSFSMVGKRRANLRHSVSRARREGLSVLRYDDRCRSERRTAQLAAISETWLRAKGGPELGFTLGRFDPDRLRDQEVYVAVLHQATAREQVVGFVTWLPYSAGRAAVLDLMRRGDPCPPGTMETLIVDSLSDFSARGRQRASLGGVPLAATEPREGRLQELLGWLYEHGGSAYEARGLFRFKDKFAPTWEPMFLAYPAAGDLPRIALAAIRSYLPAGAVREALAQRVGLPVVLSADHGPP